jgi:putative CRISPR-associated protein (TIGR02619 family)
MDLIGSDYPVAFISSIGTSVLTQYQRHHAKNDDRFAAFYQSLTSGSQPDDISKWQSSIAEKTDWGTCAELNSIRLFVKFYSISEYSVYFMPSDTEASSFCEGIVTAFLQENNIQVLSTVSKNLHYDGTDNFSRIGFPALIENVNAMIKKAHGNGELAILNATPGYKAETSILTLMGAITKTPVFYTHEGMHRPFLLPAMPLTVSKVYWKKWRTLALAVRDKNNSDTGVMGAAEFLNHYKTLMDDEGAILFEEFDNGVTLSTLGHIFCEVHEGEENAPTIPESRIAEEKRVSLPKDSHHYPKGMKKLLASLAQLPFVEKLTTKELANSSVTRVLNHMNPERPNQLFIQWSDGSTAVKIIMNTTATNERQLIQARSMVNEHLELRALEEGRPIPSMSEILSSTKINLIERLADFEDRFTEIVQENVNLNSRISELEARQQALETAIKSPVEQEPKVPIKGSWLNRLFRTIRGAK